MSLFRFTRNDGGWDYRLVLGPFEAAYAADDQAQVGVSVGPIRGDVTVFLDDAPVESDEETR